MISVIIPAKNEEIGLRRTLEGFNELLNEYEVIVVDDGSTDATALVAEEFGVVLCSHPYSKGNGAAIKTGARAAQGDILVMMDADGQHSARDIEALLHRMEDGFDMVVGARSSVSHASYGRLAANSLYNKLAEWMTGHKVLDLTSGFRVVRADKFREFLFLLPNGFSYPTTITMAFFRAGYSIFYEPVTVSKRDGKSHIRPIKDGLRFLLIIFKIATLYSPLKIFFPISVIVFILGLSRYIYTYFYMGVFTNMSAGLLVSSVQIFLIGLVSEQIASLIYKDDK